MAAAALLLVATQARPAPPRVLVVTYSAGYQHDVVRRPAPAEPSTAERVLADLGRRSGRFDVTLVATRDELERLTAASVRTHRAIVFFTTGELPLASAVRQAMFQSVRDGGGFVGVHSATDTWYTVPEYRELLGGTFDGHPWHQRVRLVVEDRTHPATRHLGDTFEITDEIYQIDDFRDDNEILLRLDPMSVDRTKPGAHLRYYNWPMAWTRKYGKGRTFYTALGHEDAVWRDQRFQQLLYNGIEWAMGEVKEK